MSQTLAIQGGVPVIREKLPSWPTFDAGTIRAAMVPLRTGRVNYWTGALGTQFEEQWAAYNGARYCISTTNGTSALHTALSALGVGPGDEVIVPSYTFIATSFAVLQAGAIPVFADVNAKDHCIAVSSIRKLIGARTRAIIPVHLYGNVCDMADIMTLAEERNLFVIEDCAQAHGAMLEGRKVGTFGHAGCFSFCQSKSFTTGGEGGAIVTNDEALAWECRSFRDHGYDVKERLRLLELEGRLPYIHNRVGFNYRMTEMQSAIGLAQLKKFDSWNLKNRRRNGEILLSMLEGCPQIRHLPVHDREEKRNGFFVFPITLDLDALGVNLEAVLKALTAEGVPNHPVFWPQCFKERAYQDHNGFGRAKFPFRSQEYTDPARVRYEDVACPEATRHQSSTFVTFVHPTLTARHMGAIGKGILKVLSAYAKDAGRDRAGAVAVGNAT